jgi:hypothetical protein
MQRVKSNRNKNTWFEIPLNKHFYISFQYNKLDVKDIKTTDVLGISEVCMARVVTGKFMEVISFV